MQGTAKFAKPETQKETSDGMITKTIIQSKTFQGTSAIA